MHETSVHETKSLCAHPTLEIRRLSWSWTVATLIDYILPSENYIKWLKAKYEGCISPVNELWQKMLLTCDVLLV